MCFTSDLPEHRGDRDRVYVYFCSERNVSKAAMKTYVAFPFNSLQGNGGRVVTDCLNRFIGLIDKSQARRGIIIHPDKLGSAARKVGPPFPLTSLLTFFFSMEADV